MPLLTLIFTLLSILNKKTSVDHQSINMYLLTIPFLSLNRSCVEIICTCWCYDIVNIWMGKVLRKNRLRHYTKCFHFFFLSFSFTRFQTDRYQFFFRHFTQSQRLKKPLTCILWFSSHSDTCYVNWYTAFCPSKLTTSTLEFNVRRLPLFFCPCHMTPAKRNLEVLIKKNARGYIQIFFPAAKSHSKIFKCFQYFGWCHIDFCCCL